MELGAVIPGETDEFGRSQKLEQLLEARAGITDVHIRRDLGHNELCIHYDPEEVTLTQVLTLARSTGASISKRYQQKAVFVRGMESAQCGYVIEHAV